MSNPEDDEPGVLRAELVDNPVMAEAERAETGKFPLERLAGQGIGRDRFQSGPEPGDLGGRDSLLIPAGGRSELQKRRHLPIPHTVGLAKYLFVGEELPAPGLLSGLPQAAGESPVAQDLQCL